MIRVFVVDAHENARRRLARVVAARRNLEVVGEAGTVQQALVRIAATAPDVVVLSARLPDGDGVRLCRTIRSADPETRCLMLAADVDATTAAVLAGASGWVSTDIRGKALAEAIREAAAGRSLISADAAERVIASLAGSSDDPADAPGLTPRGRQVLRLIGEGLTNRQIGERLDAPERTVKDDVSALLAAIDRRRPAEPSAYASAPGA